MTAKGVTTRWLPTVRLAPNQDFLKQRHKQRGELLSPPPRPGRT